MLSGPPSFEFTRLLLTKTMKIAEAISIIETIMEITSIAFPPVLEFRFFAFSGTIERPSVLEIWFFAFSRTIERPTVLEFRFFAISRTIERPSVLEIAFSQSNTLLHFFQIIKGLHLLYHQYNRANPFSPFMNKMSGYKCCRINVRRNTDGLFQP